MSKKVTKSTSQIDVLVQEPSNERHIVMVKLHNTTNEICKSSASREVIVMEDLGSPAAKQIFHEINQIPAGVASHLREQTQW